MSHWVELREKNANHWCRMDEGVVRRSHLLPLPLPDMGMVSLAPLWQWVVTRGYFSCQLKSCGEHAGVGGWQIMLSTGSSAKTSMCFIEQMLLVQYGISFRFIFALGLTHFLFRILKKSLLWCSDEKYICCLHIISIKYDDMLNAGAVCLSL